MRSIGEIRQQVSGMPGKRVIAVAAAQDREVLEALQAAKDMGLAEPLLVGDQDKIMQAAEEARFDVHGVPIIDEEDPSRAARIAVDRVRRGEAGILMKGLLSTAHFLRAVLDESDGLRTGGIISHVAVFEVPSLARLLLVTDCAMNIAPGLQDKVEIIRNVATVARALGIMEPKVAAVCAVETVNPDMPATVDAALLAKMADRGQIRGMVIDGPLGFDNAVSRESAQHKGIRSPVAGEADIILVPGIEAGNVLYKSLVYLAGVKNAGIIMGAAAPVVLTSRSDSSAVKLNSIALSVLVSERTGGIRSQ